MNGAQAAGCLPVAEVALNVPLRRSFDYLIPQSLRGRVPVGGRVRVPFGHRQQVLGYCVGLKSDSDVPVGKLREIVQSLDGEPIFTERMLQLARWMADYYRCSYGEALHAAVPAAVHSGRKHRRSSVVNLAMPASEARAFADQLFERSPAQSKLLRTLVLMGGKAQARELMASASASRSTLNALRKKGVVEIRLEAVEKEEPLDLAPLSAEPLQQPHVLTDEQRRAYDLVVRRIERGQFDIVLLHGVTSSGKTEVYMQVIAEVVRRGKQAIVLVPEISLTPQTVRCFQSRFRRLAVLHSRLTESERRRYWHLIRAGEADVVIGARSAIFAPVPSLGLLVIDEEHENSFKQEDVPRYHARDVGVMRARLDNAPVVLGSATPSLESYYNSLSGNYSAVSLRRRIGGWPLPPVEIVDMRHEWAGRGRPRVISSRLDACMRESLSAGHQVILFVNRRGFAPFVQCPRCGYVLKCPRCEITLNYHAGINLVMCHYCGLEQRPPRRCPDCALEGIRYAGTGTERVETAVRELFPDTVALRMDSDTMKTRHAHERTLEEFRLGRAGVLVGTQMIAKGLDFPNVTTVGVVNADVALHLPDFRSRERTFQLLAQVAGRAGRGPAGGRVIVQTFRPNDPSIQAAARYSYEQFAEQELEARRHLNYPPFGHMARIIARGTSLAPIQRYMNELTAQLRRLCGQLGDGSHVLGPALAPVARIKRRYRYHTMLKCPSAASLNKVLEEVTDLLKGPAGVKVIVDVDPLSML